MAQTKSKSPVLNMSLMAMTTNIIQMLNLFHFLITVGSQCHYQFDLLQYFTLWLHSKNCVCLTDLKIAPLFLYSFDKYYGNLFNSSQQGVNILVCKISLFDVTDWQISKFQNHFFPYNFNAFFYWPSGWVGSRAERWEMDANYPFQIFWNKLPQRPSLHSSPDTIGN
jgi:hypothetical protein